MNKTFTAAIALTTIVGIALAIETDPAGYIDVSTSDFVINPFNSFSGTANPTLADFDGSEITVGDASVRVISEKGKKLFDARFLPAGHSSATGGEGWYVWDGSEYGVLTNSHPLLRGQSIQFNGTATLTMAGTLNTNDVTSLSLSAGHNFIGNVSPVEKPLTSVSITNFNADGGDYVYVNGAKYAYYKGNWYDFNAFRSAAKVSSLTPITAEAVTIGAGQGFRVYCGKRYGTQSLPTVSLSGSVD